jgi:hypothetical protein
MACDESGWGANRDSQEYGALTYLSNVTVADVDLDGRPDLVAGLSGLHYGLSLALSRWVPYQDHMVVVWDARTGEALDAWPRVVEDIGMFVKPAVADISGDGLPEVITSSGGYAVHAWDADGIEPDGWPKFTGGWVYSALRAGDVNGDGRLEVVALTREGWLFVWQTAGRAAVTGEPEVPASPAVNDAWRDLAGSPAAPGRVVSPAFLQSPSGSWRTGGETEEPGSPHGGAGVAAGVGDRSPAPAADADHSHRSARYP